jgi:hypothetical protein
MRPAIVLALRQDHIVDVAIGEHYVQLLMQLYKSRYQDIFLKLVYSDANIVICALLGMESGTIGFIRLSPVRHTSSCRYYELCVRDRVRMQQVTNVACQRSGITLCYGRVTSQNQKTAGDLARQIDEVNMAYPNVSKLFKGVVSGLNFNRKGFQALLDTLTR